MPDRVPISQKVLHLSAQLILTKARWFVPGSISLLSFITIALLTAATTFTVLDNYPALIQWEKNSSYIAIAGKIFWSSFLIAAPFLWCVALIVRRPICNVILKAHAAIATVSLVPDLIEPPNHQAHMAHLAVLISRVILLIFVGVDLLIALIAGRPSKRRSRLAHDPKFVYIGLTVAVLAGLYCGILAWSPNMPPRVIAAAETAAEGRPYCIIVDGIPARNAGDLTGWRMRAQHSGGWRWNFHALLAVKGSTGFTYFNWSYPSGNFEPVTEHARLGLGLDNRVRCKPEPHFARDWHR